MFRVVYFLHFAALFDHSTFSLIDSNTVAPPTTCLPSSSGCLREAPHSPLHNINSEDVCLAQRFNQEMKVKRLKFWSLSSNWLRNEHN